MAEQPEQVQPTQRVQAIKPDREVVDLISGTLKRHYFRDETDPEIPAEVLEAVKKQTAEAKSGDWVLCDCGTICASKNERDALGAWTAHVSLQIYGELATLTARRAAEKRRPAALIGPRGERLS